MLFQAKVLNAFKNLIFVVVDYLDHLASTGEAGSEPGDVEPRFFELISGGSITV